MTVAEIQSNGCRFLNFKTKKSVYVTEEVLKLPIDIAIDRVFQAAFSADWIAILRRFGNPGTF